MILKFSELRDINIEGVQKIFITDEGDEPLRIITDRCKSYGVRRSDIYDNVKSLSLVLDEDSLDKLMEYILEVEEHLNVKFPSVFYGKGENSIYPKIRENSVFYDDDNATIDPFEQFERKMCEMRCVLELDGVIVKEGKYSLQIKVYEAKIYKRKHVRILDLDKNNVFFKKYVMIFFYFFSSSSFFLLSICFPR